MNDGRSIPALGFGVWQTRSGRQCEGAVLAAIEAGYRHIDTAAIYGNEESVGKAVRESGIPREEIFITTKLWNEDHGNPSKAIDVSLKRLGVDYVDLYLIHFPVAQRNASWKVMQTMQAAGKARSIGVSNFTIRHLEDLLGKSQTTPAINQIELHPFLYQSELMEYCTTKRILVQAYSPLTHGQRLTDPRLLAIARRYERSAAQILIRWALQRNTVVIPKSIHPERIRENAAVFDFQISDSDMSALDSLNENLRTCWDPTNVP
jgi:diketogulonate reductase-like aldo/keto reductase